MRVSDAQSQSESKSPQRWNRLRLPVKIALLLAVYVFSIGPMFWQWYEAEFLGSSPLLRVFYAPLRLACGIPLVEDWLNRYINWWIA